MQSMNDKRLHGLPNRCGIRFQFCGKTELLSSQAPTLSQVSANVSPFEFFSQIYTMVMFNYSLSIGIFKFLPSG
jgi:hypothetical protein